MLLKSVSHVFTSLKRHIQGLRAALFVQLTLTVGSLGNNGAHVL